MEGQRPKSRRRNTRWTTHARAVFLKEIAETGNVSEACRKVRKPREGAYQLRKRDKKFAAAWESAKEQAADVLEAEAFRRGVTGWDEPVYQQGAQVGLVRRYDSALLTTLLRGNRPEKFRERHEIMGKDGGPIKSEATTIQLVSQVPRPSREAS